MHSEDRVIHFSTELIHLPRQHDQQALRKLYYDLSQTRFSYDSSDFSTPPQYRFYSRRGSKTQSLAVFLPDRMALVEEWADQSLSDYHERLREVAQRALAGLRLGEFRAQTVTLRSTFTLTHFDDARVFLMDHACGQRDRIGAFFRRPVAVGGLRFVLPATPEDPGELHVLIESFRHDPREVFVEVKGIFGNATIGADTLDAAIDNIRFVRSFIVDRVFPYLDQFDTPAEDLP